MTATALGQPLPAPRPEPHSGGGSRSLAAAPIEIPVKGWRDIFWRVAYGAVDDHVFALARRSRLLRAARGVSGSRHDCIALRVVLRRVEHFATPCAPVQHSATGHR